MSNHARIARIVFSSLLVSILILQTISPSVSPASAQEPGPTPVPGA